MTIESHSRTSLLTIGLGVALTAAAIAATTSAEARRYRHYDEGNYVVAESRFGNGTVSGPVRYTDRGRQVQLPGGTWVWCARLCSETLRVETVDFWESEKGGKKNGTSDHSVFGPIEFRWGW